MDEAKRIDELRQDITDYQNAKGCAEDAEHYEAAKVFQELIDEARRTITTILGGEMVLA